MNTALILSGQAVIMISAVLGYLSTRKRVGNVHNKVTDVETLVNGQLDRQLRYNGQLAAKLTASGVSVPEQERAKDAPAGKE